MESTVWQFIQYRPPEKFKTHCSSVEIWGEEEFETFPWKQRMFSCSFNISCGFSLSLVISLMTDLTVFIIGREFCQGSDFKTLGLLGTSAMHLAILAVLSLSLMIVCHPVVPRAAIKLRALVSCLHLMWTSVKPEPPRYFQSNYL